MNSIGGARPGKYRPGIGGHSAPDSTATALSRRSVQQVLAARAATVLPPSDWPAAPTSCGSSRPENRSPGRALSASSLVRTYDMSCGWFTRSASSASAPRWQLVRGKVTAATTYPALAQACSRSAVRAGALQEPRGEQQQRERPGGPAGPGIPDLGHQCALAEMLACRACAGGLGKRHLPLTGPVAAVAADGGGCGRRGGGCPRLGSGRGRGHRWPGRVLLRLARAARCQCEHDENSGEDQPGVPDGRSHDWMLASRTCLIQAKLPEPARTQGVLVLCRRAGLASCLFHSRQ